jgi:hypothetical protein
VPRRIQTVAHIPLTETGKPARHEAERLVSPRGKSPGLP